MSEHSQPASPGGEPKLEMMGSRGFNAWLAEERISLAFTTYRTGKLFLIGMQPNGRLSVFERTFNRCMGLWSDGQTLWMSSLYQLWRFENAVPAGLAANGYDRLYVPRVGHVTGDIDIHDVAVDRAGRVLFVNTLFGCLATVSQSDSFIPLWQPPFISKLAAEDRCHLNGLALDDGRPRYMTMVARTDVADGWRDRRSGGGCVMDIHANEIVADGLSMPHSPRVYRDDLWLLDSGSGFFGRVDRQKGGFQPIAFCPGYMRGLAFVGDYAIVGLSHSRENRTFQGLRLDDNLRQRNADTRCGLFVVHLPSGDVRHWLRIDGIVQELYDVVVLPNTIRPMALGFKTDEIRRTISIGDAQPL